MIESYPSDRLFFVSVGSSLSTAIADPSEETQGSVIWLLLFMSHVAPSETWKSNRKLLVGYHKCADDNQLYAALTVSLIGCLNRLQECTVDRQLWFRRKDFLLTSDKLETWTRCTYQRWDLSSSTAVVGCSVDMREKLKTLGITFYSTLCFDDVINTIVYSCNLHFWALGHIDR